MTPQQEPAYELQKEPLISLDWMVIDTYTDEYISVSRKIDLRHLAGLGDFDLPHKLQHDAHHFYSSFTGRDACSRRGGNFL